MLVSLLELINCRLTDRYNNLKQRLEDDIVVRENEMETDTKIIFDEDTFAKLIEYVLDNQISDYPVDNHHMTPEHISRLITEHNSHIDDRERMTYAEYNFHRDTNMYKSNSFFHIDSNKDHVNSLSDIYYDLRYLIKKGLYYRYLTKTHHDSSLEPEIIDVEIVLMDFNQMMMDPHSFSN